jgi:hypothetical protein
VGNAGQESLIAIALAIEFLSEAEATQCAFQPRRAVIAVVPARLFTTAAHAVCRNSLLFNASGVSELIKLKSRNLRSTAIDQHSQNPPLSLQCGKVRFGSNPAVTASQHCRPLHFNQRTLGQIPVTF